MATETITLITAIVGAVCGITGAVLGIMNTWNQMQRKSVKIKILPTHVIPVGALENAPLNFGLEVINLSEFPVVVEDVGFLLTGGRHGTLATVPGRESNGALPLRLEPRSSYSKLFHVDQGTVDWRNVRCAYARTQCGTEATGTSGALKQLIREGARRDG